VHPARSHPAAGIEDRGIELTLALGSLYFSSIFVSPFTMNRTSVSSQPWPMAMYLLN